VAASCFVQRLLDSQNCFPGSRGPAEYDSAVVRANIKKLKLTCGQVSQLLFGSKAIHTYADCAVEIRAKNAQ
jgi:hypothetical protein